MTAPALEMYVIYWNPSDYPEKFVVRRWRVGLLELIAENTAFVADTIELARSVVPPGMVRLSAQPDDDPAVYETWL